MWPGWWRSHCYSWCSWIWRVPPCNRSKPSLWHLNSHKIVTLVGMLHCTRGLRNIQKGQQLCYTVDFLKLFSVALGKTFFFLSRKGIPCQLWVDQGKCNAQIQCSFGIYLHTGSFIWNFWKHFKHKSAGSYATMDRRSAFASCYRLHLRMPYFTLFTRRVNIGFRSFLSISCSYVTLLLDSKFWCGYPYGLGVVGEDLSWDRNFCKRMDWNTCRSWLLMGH
jgi:hypothetical protein